jgi:DNA primase
VSVPEFEIKRHMAAADLSTPGGRDEALSAVVPVIRNVPRNSATWDHLVRYVSDRLSVDPQYLDTLLSAPAAPDVQARHPVGSAVVATHTSRLPSIEGFASKERSFLAMCLANGETGRRYLDGLNEDHFSSQPLWRVREHLVAHFDDPLAGLPDDPGLASLISEIVFLAEDELIREASLRATRLLLDMQKTDRLLRRAEQTADYETQRALWPEREGLRREYEQLMGQTQ